ncbi:hypothetical protein B0H13DRAFT_1892235 [Mycena leptocephala]|nr:hypothetical protein B0H13DRAFT_1892235 [Mycena leptocephala]
MERPGAQREKDARSENPDEGWMDDAVCTCSRLASVAETPDPRRGSKSSCNSIPQEGQQSWDRYYGMHSSRESQRKRNHDRESEKAKATSSFHKKETLTLQNPTRNRRRRGATRSQRCKLNTTRNPPQATHPHSHSRQPRSTSTPPRRAEVKQERLRPLFFGLHSAFMTLGTARCSHPSRHGVRAFLGQINPGTRSPPSADLDQQRGPASVLLEQHPRSVPQDEL